MSTRAALTESFASVITMESRTEITDYFYGLLSRESTEGFEQLLSVNPSLREQLAKSQEGPLQNRLPLAQQRRNLLYAGHHFLPELFGRDTGLFDFAPPDTVHAMVRSSPCNDASSPA